MLNRKQIAALVGLAPFNRDSGTLRGSRCISGGRAQVRRVLYMATVAGDRSNPTIRTFYLRLRTNCKHAKPALIACMRKFPLFSMPCFTTKLTGKHLRSLPPLLPFLLFRARFPNTVAARGYAIMPLHAIVTRYLPAQGDTSIRSVGRATIWRL